MLRQAGYEAEPHGAWAVLGLGGTCQLIGLTMSIMAESTNGWSICSQSTRYAACLAAVWITSCGIPPMGIYRSLAASAHRQQIAHPTMIAHQL
jgi:hypothetical protein